LPRSLRPKTVTGKKSLQERLFLEALKLISTPLKRTKPDGKSGAKPKPSLEKPLSTARKSAKLQPFKS
jgi:hypothetical protein